MFSSNTSLLDLSRKKTLKMKASAVLLHLTAWAGVRQSEDRRRHSWPGSSMQGSPFVPGKCRVFGPAGTRPSPHRAPGRMRTSLFSEAAEMWRPPPVPAQQVPPAGMRQLSTRGRLCPGQCPPRQRLSWHQGSGSHVSDLSRALPGSPEGPVTCAHAQDAGWTLCLFCGTRWTPARLSLSPLLSWVCGSMPSAHSAELSLQASEVPRPPLLCNREMLKGRATGGLRIARRTLALLSESAEGSRAL